MSGSLRNHWEYTLAEIWESLSVHDQAPADLFNDLYDEADDYLALSAPAALRDEIRNDAVKAKQAFTGLKGTDFINEMAIADFLEAAHEVISDYAIPGYAELFKKLLRSFIRKYNLRYRLDDPFKLRFLLPGSFTNLYAELQRLNAADGHLATLLLEFEHAFDRYSRTIDPGDLKTCIAKASNYAEGLASRTMGNPVKNNTLGALCNGLTCWPHDKVRDSLINLYHFCCDYPGIRHGGKPASARRNLASLDSTLMCMLLLSFSGYLSPLIDEQAVLGA